MENNNAGVQPVETGQELNTEVPTPNEIAPVVEEEKVELTKAEVNDLINAAEDATALATKEAENAENYKKGMLKAKGKLVENGLPEEDEPETITREEAQRIADEAVQKALKDIPKEDELAKANKTISELKVTLNNRMQISPTNGGSNLDKPEPKGSSIFSPDQEAELKARALRIGADPDEYIREVASNLANPYELKDLPSKRT